MKMASNKPLKILVADDHRLFRKGLISLIHELDSSFQVVKEVNNGKELMQYLQMNELDLVVLDVNMPIMDGFATIKAIRKSKPHQKVLALSMLDDETTLIRMLKDGVNGFLNKDIEPPELFAAITAIMNQGNYYTDLVAGKLIEIIREENHEWNTFSDLSEQELKFIELACTEDTYQMIADKMFLSVKTIDGYRAKLFDKLGVKSRVGLVMYALRHKIVSL